MTLKLVFIENNRLVTDSLTVAETFGKNHKDVLRDIRNLECSEEFGQRNFAPSSYTSEQNKELPKCIITQDGFSFLVMGFTGSEAARFKEMYIGEFNRMSQQLTAQFQIPQSFTEALRLAADLAEKNEQLLLVSAQKDQIINELQPKASYVDEILKSKSTVTITQIAKDYGISGQKLNTILHEEGIQYKMNGQWLLYRKHQDQGYTKSQTIDIIHNSGEQSVKMNTQWTQKGRLFIHELLRNRGIIPYMDRESA